MKSFVLGNSSVFAILMLLLIPVIVVSPVCAQVASVVKVLSTPNPVVQGQNVTFTAGVNWSQTAAPSGTITLTDTVVCSGSSMVVALGAITLGSATSATPGAGTLAVSSFPCTGANSIVASYKGDSNYLAGTSQPLMETVLAQFTPASTTLSSSLSSSTVGQSITFTAQLGFTVTNNTYPTGTLTFKDTKTGVVLGTAAVQTAGARAQLFTGATLTTSSLGVGSYAVQAAYSGDSIYSPSMSQIVNVVVAASAGGAPTISTVVTTQGNELSLNSNIAQNTWVEVHGVNLSPSTMDWSSQDFSKGLPTALGGVSATVNNKPAAVSFISPNQVNILTPLDDTTGSVPLQLTTPNGKTAIVTLAMQQTSPSFLVLDGAGHAAARHADFSLVGPASMSVPGFQFTPAKPGEIVLLYAVGFGQTSPPITDQAHGMGSLPTPPGVAIGGIAAAVLSEAISGPGLYQLNVVVPQSAPDGDLTLSASYNGAVTQNSGVDLTVQH